MSHVATAPHECGGHLHFATYGLSPYWSVGKLLLDNYQELVVEETEADVRGETWTFNGDYQKSGIAPRLEDNVSERMYEFLIRCRGPGERKVTFRLSPRFEEMRHFETGEALNFSLNRMNVEVSELVNVHFQGSNLEPDEYPEVLAEAVQAFASKVGASVNDDYFRNTPHETSTITTYERYVRIHRSKSSKVVGRTGVLHRLFHLCSTEKGSKFEYKVDNEDIVGKNHRAVLRKQDAKRLVSWHKLGKQIKHYHPKHVRKKKKKDDPLYHPKLGVLAKKNLTGRAFRWSNRREITREIDETLINVLYWSDVPVQPDPTTYISDDHFVARTADDPVELMADPTPELEASQDALLVTVLRDLCDSDMDVLETLAANGGEKHVHKLKEETNWSLSTLYRALKRMDGIVRNENGRVSFVSRKVEQEIAGIVSSAELQLRRTADRVARLLNVETRAAASSAWEMWCQKYGAKIENSPNEDQMVVRIDTVLSELKSSTNPRVQDVLEEALLAWVSIGQDPVELRHATVKWQSSTGEYVVGTVGPTLR